MELSMYRFVTKKELWAVEDSGLTAKLAPSRESWSLKNIQDAVAYKHLQQFKGKTVAEVGGGDSRVLPTLARQNSCCNIEPFEGQGNGPTTNTLPSEIIKLKAYLGQTDLLIKDGKFDVLFSISVIEHVPEDKLESFFADSRRILKAEGFALHMIDIYVSEEPSLASMKRHQSIGDLFFSYFQPLTPSEVMGRNGNWADALRFHCRYATNPDNAMNYWNKIAPQLRNIREEQQSCTLILAGLAN